MSPDDLRSEWIASICRLYSTIEGFFQEYVEQKLLSIERTSDFLSEERLGNYQVEYLHLVSGPERIIFTPRARLVAGATGRVDAYNQRRSDTGYILLRQKMNSEELWTINTRNKIDNLLMWFIRPSSLTDIGSLETTICFDKDNTEKMIESMLPQ